MNNPTPYVMHPRYAQFEGFMRECPHRQSAECKEVAFWVWIKIVEQAEALLCVSEAREDLGAI